MNLCELNEDIHQYPIRPKYDSSQLSIVIPTYQNINFLIPCIDSILKSCDNQCQFEILLGIDCCYDTLNFVSQNSFFDDKRIKVFFSSKNVGPYVIRNSLVEIAKYENVLFFDSDDIMMKNMVENLLMSFREQVVRFKFYNFEEGKDYKDINNLKTSKRVGHGVFLVKRKKFIEMNGFFGWRCGADSEFMERYEGNNNKSVLLNKPLFYRRYHETNLTRDKTIGINTEIRTQYLKIIAENKDNKCWKNPLELETVKLRQICTNIDVNIVNQNVQQYSTKKNEIIYDYCVVITTYNRCQMLKVLLQDIFKNCKNKSVKVVVFDDASDAYIDVDKYDVQLIRYHKNNGKTNFWKVIEDTFKYVKNINARYYFYLQDDVRLVDNFFEQSVEIYEKIDDHKKISLGTLMVESQRNTPKWTNFVPENHGDFYKTQWCELFFVAERKFFEVLEYKMNPISIDRWKNRPNLGSGVGEQISHRLLGLGYNMYHVVNSLAEHGDHESTMNTSDRKTTKLIAKHDNI